MLPNLSMHRALTVFQTGDEKLRELETSTFVAAGRFRYEQGKPVVVEYKVSKVVKG